MLGIVVAVLIGQVPNYLVELAYHTTPTAVRAGTVAQFRGPADGFVPCCESPAAYRRLLGRLRLHPATLPMPLPGVRWAPVTSERHAPAHTRVRVVRADPDDTNDPLGPVPHLPCAVAFGMLKSWVPIACLRPEDEVAPDGEFALPVFRPGQDGKTIALEWP